MHGCDYLESFFSCIICAGGLVVSGHHSDKVEVEVQFFVGVLVRCEIVGYFYYFNLITL